MEAKAGENKKYEFLTELQLSIEYGFSLLPPFAFHL